VLAKHLGAKVFLKTVIGEQNIEILILNHQVTGKGINNAFKCQVMESVFL
jgi:hypothetical protein